MNSSHRNVGAPAVEIIAAELNFLLAGGKKASNANFAAFAKLCGAKGFHEESAGDLDDALVIAHDCDVPAFVEVLTDVNLSYHAMIATLFLSILGIYFAVGCLFALVFLIADGPQKIDPGAVNGTLGFRILIFPGCMLFWPILLKRWAKSESLPTEFSAHRIKS